MREFGADRCFLCGNYMVLVDGELRCLKCNCSVSEVDYFIPSEEMCNNE